MNNQLCLIFSLLLLYNCSCQSNQIPVDDNSRFGQKEAIWGGTTYFNKEDTVYVGKQIPYPKGIKGDSELMNLPKPLILKVRNNIIDSFDKERKRELKVIKQWFAVNIYINDQGILQELEYEIPEKFKISHPEITINESDLLKMEQKLKGMQLALPTWWKGIGYARIVIPIRFSKL